MPLSLSEVVPVRLFHDDAFRWRLSTRSLDAAGWLQFDDQVDRYLAEKETILNEHGDDAVAYVSGSEGPANELAALIEAAVESEGRSMPTRHADEHPIVWSARAVQEDLCVLQRRPEGWVLTAAAVCFPTRWSPAAKVGLELGQVHGPVPRYGEIAATVDRFFDRLRPGAIAWRPNWSIVGDDRLRLPVDDRQAPTGLPADPLRTLWLRIERQTVRRLIDHPEATVFTIRVHRWPLGESIIGLEAALAAELRTIPDDIARYKNLDEWRMLLAGQLDRG